MKHRVIGSKIAKLRKKKGISQEVLAERLNVTRQAISNWERNKSEPDINTLNMLAEILDTDLNYFAEKQTHEEASLESISMTGKMKRKPILLVVLAVVQSLIAIAVFLWYLRVSAIFAEDSKELIVLNSYLLLFPLSTYAILKGKVWGWWLSAILYGVQFWDGILLLMTLTLLTVSTPPLMLFLEVIGYAIIYSFFFMKQNLAYFTIDASRKWLFIRLLAASLVIQVVFNLFLSIFI